MHRLLAAIDHLFRLTLHKIILAGPLAVNVGGRTMQGAAKGVGIAERYWDHFEAELVELFHLVDLASLNADRFWVKHKHVHR